MGAMMGTTTASLIAVGIPLVGALLSFACWSIPDWLKVCAIATAVVSLGAIGGLAGFLAGPTEGFLFLVLLPLAAVVSLLGQPVHPLYRSSSVMTLLFLGLGLGVLTQNGPVGHILLATIGGLIGLLLYRHHSPLWPMSWWGIGTFGFSMVMAVAAAFVYPSLSAIASLLAGAVFLPLAPLHGGYLAALTRLPGNLPSFLSVLLPVIGLHSLTATIGVVPDGLASAVSVTAVVGSLYGAVKALAQSRVRLRLAYGSLSFLCLLWWFAASARGTGPGAAVFTAAVALVTSGLLIAWQVVRSRYGDDVDPQSISGLAAGMPHYAVLLSLLGLAAIGLPPFGVFAGFIGLLLAPTVSFSIALVCVLLVWLAASWYILDLVQRLLFGPRRSDLRLADLGWAEFASLLLVVLALVMLGVLPAHLFGPGAMPTTAETGWFAWMK
ncbi:MAG: hypothetical protein GDA67_08985 [Nitrospira sp. CR1.3]|nr:hypothetical protein [Nitrospira sp. CR1.3]